MRDYPHSARQATAFRWALVAIASLMPFIAGGVSGFVYEPFSLEISFRNSQFANAVSWIMCSLALVSPIGFAVWLAWRFPFAQKRPRKLLIYGLLLGPPCLLTMAIFERVSLFVQWELIEKRHAGTVIAYGDEILDESMSDVIFFITIVMVLSVIRHSLGISALRFDDTPTVNRDLSIRSMLWFTFTASLLFLAIGRELQLNRAELGTSNSRHGVVSFLDVLGIVTPISSAIAIGTVVALLTLSSTWKLAIRVPLFVLSFAILLLPGILQRQSFHWIDFGPEDASVGPHRFDCIGAFSTVLVCAGCLASLRRAGIQIQGRRLSACTSSRSE